MITRNAFILMSLLAAAITGCDQTVATEWAAPQVRVSFVDGMPAVAKGSTLLNVSLEVRSRGGTDYSPESMTVDNATTSQVAFDVSIPPDSIYSFTVRFSAAGQLVAEGGTYQQVSLETTVIKVNVLTTSTSTPSIAFLPSQVNTSTGSGNIEIAVRYYGVDQPAAGVAALLDVTGPTPGTFTLEGADLSFVDSGQLNAAWKFAQDVEGVQDIGTLRLSRSQAVDFCLQADGNNVRIVDRNGNIKSAALLGTCISVTK